jgi:hypothetical protein
MWVDRRLPPVYVSDGDFGRSSHFNEPLPRLVLCHPCDSEEIRGRVVVWAGKVREEND